MKVITGASNGIWNVCWNNFLDINNIYKIDQRRMRLLLWIRCEKAVICCRGGICQCRHCRRQCKIFDSGVNFSIFTHFLCFFLLKLLKLGENDGVKFLTWKSGGVNFLSNSMSGQATIGFGFHLMLLLFLVCCWQLSVIMPLFPSELGQTLTHKY